MIEKKRGKKIYIRCNEAEHRKIKERAEEHNTTVSDYVLSKALDIPLEKVVEKDYEFTVKDSKGVSRTYKHKYIPKIKKTCMAYGNFDRFSYKNKLYKISEPIECLQWEENNDFRIEIRKYNITAFGKNANEVFNNAFAKIKEAYDRGEITDIEIYSI